MWLLVVTIFAVASCEREIPNIALKATPGVIKSELGKVSLAQDVLTVKLNMDPVKEFLITLQRARTEVKSLLDLSVINNNTVNVLRAQLDKLELSLPSRRKRSLFNFGGEILKSIFGTAT